MAHEKSMASLAVPHHSSAGRINNRISGNPIWKALNDRQAYTAPQLAVLSGKRQILVVSATRVVGLAPEDGALLWQYPWAPYQGISAAQPVVAGENRFFISAGYDRGAALVEISALGNPFQARTIWKNKRMKNKFSGSVMHEGYIYGLADPEGHHELARFPAIEGKTWNVPAIADGKLIVRNKTEMACFRIGK